MSPKGGLGKGLGALIPADFDSNEQASGVKMIPVSQIIANPRQPRSTIDSSDLEELSASIREHGICSPSLSRKTEILVLSPWLLVNVACAAKAIGLECSSAGTQRQ